MLNIIINRFDPDAKRLFEKVLFNQHLIIAKIQKEMATLVETNQKLDDLKAAVAAIPAVPAAGAATAADLDAVNVKIDEITTSVKAINHPVA